MSDLPPFTVRFDVTKLDEDVFYKAKKAAADGHTPVYCTLQCWPLKAGANDYGDTHLVKQDLGPDLRKAGIEAEIIGNAKPILRRGEQATPAAPRQPRIQVPRESDQDDVPF